MEPLLAPLRAAAPEAVPYANLADPQSLNLYAYVMNNPVRNVDAFGHCGKGATGPNACSTPKPSQTKMASRQKHGRAPQELWYGTVAPVPGTTPNGGTEWAIRFALSHASKTGGYIVQHIRIHVPGHGRQGAGAYDYWEAWKVQAGSRFTGVYFKYKYDDEFEGPPGTTFYARARFYPGLKLPSTFIPHNPATAAGQLPSTIINPHLPTVNATAVNKRWWEAH